MNQFSDHSQLLTIYVARQHQKVFAHIEQGNYDINQVYHLRQFGYDVLVYFEIDLPKYPTIALLLDYLSTYDSRQSVYHFVGELVSFGSHYVMDHFEKIISDGGVGAHWRKKGEILILLQDIDDQVLLTHLQCGYPDASQDFICFFYEVGASIFHHCSYEQMVPCTRN